MKIIQLSAENVKRLKAVEITPDGTLQVITGRNAQGKTSVLDAIWLALGGGQASRSTARPIRDGEDRASVRLDLGDLVVTRTWTGNKTALKVGAADGARYNSPQAMLDGLVGRLSFDPLEFTRLSSREQVAALLDLVDLEVDLTAMATDRARIYEQRAAIGRTAKSLEGQVAGLGPMEPAPEAEMSVASLITQYREAEDKHREHAELVLEYDQLCVTIARLRTELQQAEVDQARVDREVFAMDPLPDVDEVHRMIEGAEQANLAVRRNAQRAHVKDQLYQSRRGYAEMTSRLEGIDKTKSDALAAAKLPVAGLGFDDEGVTFQGIPFAQISSSEQIRVSLAMAMALNPKLRVIRILDGSLLDQDSLRLIAEQAAEQDYQVWIERVADGSNVGVVIEDGEVQS